MQYTHLSPLQTSHPMFIVARAIPSTTCSDCSTVISFAGQPGDNLWEKIDQNSISQDYADDWNCPIHNFLHGHIPANSARHEKDDAYRWHEHAQQDVDHGNDGHDDPDGEIGHLDRMQKKIEADGAKFWVASDGDLKELFVPKYTDTVYNTWYERADKLGIDGKALVERVRKTLGK